MDSRPRSGATGSRAPNIAYADFGSVPFTIARSGGDGGIQPEAANFDVTMRTHTVTFGLAYKFN